MAHTRLSNDSQDLWTLLVKDVLRRSLAVHHPLRSPSEPFGLSTLTSDECDLVNHDCVDETPLAAVQPQLEWLLEGMIVCDPKLLGLSREWDVVGGGVACVLCSTCATLVRYTEKIPNSRHETVA